MVCLDDWTNDGPRAQIVLFQFRIRPATAQLLQFAPRAAFRRRRVLWHRTRRLCAGSRSAWTILRATECSLCADAIALKLAQPTTKGDSNQRASEESRARRLSWLVRVHRSRRTPS